MAEASIAATQPVASGYQPGQNAALTAVDLDEIQQYQNIVSFRDTVVSGKHPRIKVAKPAIPQQATFQAATERVAPPSTQPLQSVPNVNTYQVGNMQSFKENSQQPAVPITATGSSTPAIPGFPRSIGSGKAETNPVLLEKSGDLAKTHLQSQRQAIEKELREQFEQRKAFAKAPQQPSEQPADINIADILAKALTLVQATAPPSTIDPFTTVNTSDSNDSFDDNTFYSSQHESTEAPPSPRVQNPASQEIRMHGPPASTEQQVPYTPRQEQITFQPMHLPTSSSYQPEHIRSAQPVQIASSSSPPQPSSSNVTTSAQDKPAETSYGKSITAQPRQAREVEVQVISSDSRAASRSDNSRNTDSDQPADHSRIQKPRQLLPNAQFRQAASPLVRAHDLSPLAPQPAHVSPLATARRPPVAEPEISILQGTPAQVMALRQEHRVVSSPESSPQREKNGKRRNNNNNKKRNKRKAETRAPDVPASPYIKPEPRSPSPLSAPHYAARPPKRLRPSDRPGQELVYDDTRIGRPGSGSRQEQYTATHVQAERPPYDFEDVDDPYARPIRQSVAPASQRFERAVYEERRPDGTAVQYIRRVQTPRGFASPFSAMEPRPLRSASYSVNPQYGEVPTYPRDGRMSVRPYADRARSRSPVIIERQSPAMAPPGPPQARIVIDQYGRQYIEPPRASIAGRHSVVPVPRPGEREIFYERLPTRAPSRMPGGESFEEDGILYAPRRVITQPEYGVDYRSYRERDYSVQPMGVPGQDFVPIRGAMERRVPEEISRDYLPRATSVRPSESVPYYNRLETIRSDIPSRQYAASVHPEVRREPAPPLIREYSVRPAERDVTRREFSVQPVERYYDRLPHTNGEVTYVEQPRAGQQEMVYADNSRRPVYQ
ncbi:hypothetical protein AAE478_001634 [Parahypoxylon ruwenzoriense]